MKYLFIVFFLFTSTLLAQVDDYPECNCAAYKSAGLDYIPSNKSAQKIINQYLQLIKEKTAIPLPKEPILTVKANCPTPRALYCSNDLRLILFNDYFLQILNRDDGKGKITLVDKHVLAHELAHHVLGHLDRTGTTRREASIYNNPTKGDLKRLGIGHGNPIAQEFEADLLGLWLLYQSEKDFSAEKLLTQMDTLQMVEWERKFGVVTSINGKSYNTHPFFKDRLKTMRKYQQIISNFPTTIAQRGFTALSNNAYFDLWGKGYHWDLSFSGGFIVAGIPRFSLDKMAINALLYPLNSQQRSFNVGFSLTGYSWHKSLQGVLDVHWSRQYYGTSIETSNGQRLAEQLQLNYLAVSPQIGWNSVGKKVTNETHTTFVGLTANVGLNLNIPMAIDYENSIASSYQAPQLKFSAGPKVSIGGIWTKKSFLPPSIRLLVSYDLQCIHLDSTPAPTAISHNFTTTLQYAFLRF